MKQGHWNERDAFKVSMVMCPTIKSEVADCDVWFVELV